MVVTYKKMSNLEKENDETRSNRNCHLSAKL